MRPEPRHVHPHTLSDAIQHALSGQGVWDLGFAVGAATVLINGSGPSLNVHQVRRILAASELTPRELRARMELGKSPWKGEGWSQDWHDLLEALRWLEELEGGADAAA